MVFNPSSQPESKKSMNITPITLIKTRRKRIVNGSLISSTSKYLVYGLKGGLIRVVNKYSATTTILKGHTKEVTDLMFVFEKEAILISSSKDKRIILWQIVEEENKIGYKVLICINCGEERFVRRIADNPGNKLEIFCLSSDNRLYVCDLYALMECEDVEIRMGERGIKMLLEIKEGVEDIACSRDGKLFAFCTSTGRIALFKVLGKQKMKSLGNFSLFEDEELPCSSMLFVNSFDDHFIVGRKGGSELTIWKFTEDEKKVELIQKVLIQSNSKVQNISHVLKMPEKYPFLVIGNTKLPEMYVAHFVRKDETCVIDHITQFNSFYPTVSVTLLEKKSETGAMLGMFTVQTEKVQLLHVNCDDCTPKKEEDPKDESVELDEKDYLKELPDVDLVKEEEDKKDSGPKSLEELEDMLALEEANKKKKEEEEKKRNASLVEEEEILVEKVKVKDETKVPQDENIVKQGDVEEDGDPESQEEIDDDNEEIKNQHYDQLAKRKEMEATAEKTEAAKKVDEEDEVVVTESDIIGQEEERMPQGVEQRIMKGTEYLVGQAVAILQAENKRNRKVDIGSQRKVLEILSNGIIDDIPRKVEEIVEKKVNQIVGDKFDGFTAKVKKLIQSSVSKSFDKLNLNIKKAVKESTSSYFKRENEGFFKNKVVPHFEKSNKKIFTEIKAIRKDLVDKVQKGIINLKKSLLEQIEGISTANSSILDAVKRGPFDKKEVVQLLKDKKFKIALQKVLQMRSGPQTAWLVKQLDIKDFDKYGGGVELGEELLIPFIHQLTVDFESDTDIKLAWILNLILQLNVQNSSFKQNIRKLIGSVWTAVALVHKKKQSKDTAILLHTLNSMRLSLEEADSQKQ